MAEAPHPLDDPNAPGAVKPALTVMTDELHQRVAAPALFHVPFLGGHIWVGLYVMLFAPLMYLEEGARDRDWLKCAMVGVAWAVVFPPLAMWFHRRSLVHIAVSIFAWLAVVVGFPMAILLYR